MNRNIDISQEEFEAIEQYIRQEMPVEEKVEFAKRLSEDVVFQQKFETARLLLVGVREAGLSKKLEDFHRDLPAPEESTNPSHRRTISIKTWLVAASVIVILGFGSLLYLNRNSNEEKIFEAYYEPDPGLISAMDVTNNYLFDRAMIDYRTGKYDDALKTWENMLISKPGNDTLNYFIGSAYLAKGQTEQALARFKETIAKPKSYFYNDALWYTGLSFLKENKIKEAISAIEKSEHYNKDSLLLKLKKVE